MKRNVYLAQVNSTYGRNAFLPYSVGLLQTFAQKEPVIRQEYDFRGFVYMREPLDQVLSRLVRPDVLGVSCYIWNWEYSTALARAVKEQYPDCLIVLGGPHVPARSDGFFKKYPFADLLVHYEGEVTFREILFERMKPRPDYSSCLGVTVQIPDQKSLKTSVRPRLDNLDEIPSPYLSGIFDPLLEGPYDFHVSQETNRGCPYECSFCDWGSNLLAKLKIFGTERLVHELSWCSEHKIDLVYNCDANFGILKRDLALAHEMARLKGKTGSPNKFRAAYAKNSNEAVYSIANVLSAAGMNKGITLSFQSMDDHVLEVVKRRNIKVQNFKQLMTRYREANIATYSEVILGLPEETYATFADGLEKLIESGQHESIQVYTCEVLPNSEMAQREYMEKYGIRTARVPVMFYHGTPTTDEFQEYYELVVSTNALPPEDWLRCQRFALAVQMLHCLGLTQAIAIALCAQFGIRYRIFYEKILEYADLHPESVLGGVLARVTELFHDMAKGRPWGVVDAQFGPITWPLEEWGFLKISLDRARFYAELRQWVRQLAPWDRLDDLFVYQNAVVPHPDQPADFKISTGSAVHEFISQQALGRAVLLELRSMTYGVRPAKAYGGDFESFAREVVWYGRKGGSFRNKVGTNE